MLYFLSIGVLFGVTAGISPGPLLVLVISETLEHGIKFGIKVAIAPIITDFPIIVLTVFVFSQLTGFENILGVISLLGSCYVFYMGYKSIRLDKQQTNQINTKPSSLSRGVLTNALSPHPYLFWLVVGAPTVIKSTSINSVAPFLFISGFYLFMIGSKIVLAVLTGKSKSLMSDDTYLYTIRLLGLLLVILSVFLFIDGLTLLSIVQS